MTTPTMQNPAETMRDVMHAIAKHEVITQPDANTPLGAYLISQPEKRTVVDLTRQLREAAEYLKPTRRKGTARLSDLQSLIDWTNRFKGDTSALFANPDMAAPSLTCIADYHAAGPVDVDGIAGDSTARHCHHRAIYDFPLSDEWKAWMAISDSPLEKEEMGEFIEAQALAIMDPTPAILRGTVMDKNEPWENRLIETVQKIGGRYGQLAQLLEISRQFQIYETSNLKVQKNRDTGEQEVQFLNEHKTPDGQPINIPNLIIIAIPVFMGGAPYRMTVRFRYRKSGATLKFFFSIHNPEKVFEAALKEALDKARDETALPLFMGQPEA